MSQPKQDIRITKTHKALSEALVALLEQKSFQKITINDICQQSMVSRSTFYLHFEDKYQLLAFCLEQEKDYLMGVLKETDPRSFIRSLLMAVKERERIYRNLLTADARTEILEILQDSMIRFIRDGLEESERQGVELAGPIPLLAVYYSNGLASMTIYWARNGFRYSVEEMTICSYNLLADIIPD